MSTRRIQRHMLTDLSKMALDSRDAFTYLSAVSIFAALIGHHDMLTTFRSSLNRDSFVVPPCRDGNTCGTISLHVKARSHYISCGRKGVLITSLHSLCLTSLLPCRSARGFRLVPVPWGMRAPEAMCRCPGALRNDSGEWTGFFRSGTISHKVGGAWWS